MVTSPIWIEACPSSLYKVLNDVAIWIQNANLRYFSFGNRLLPSGFSQQIFNRKDCRRGMIFMGKEGRLFQSSCHFLNSIIVLSKLIISLLEFRTFYCRSPASIPIHHVSSRREQATIVRTELCRYARFCRSCVIRFAATVRRRNCQKRTPTGSHLLRAYNNHPQRTQPVLPFL